MKRYILPALLLGVFFLAGRFWSELSVHAGGGGASGGNGDINGDGFINVTDVIGLLNWMFLGGDAPVACADGGDHTHTADQLEALNHIRMVDLPNGQGGTVRTIQVWGVNLQIVNEGGATWAKNGAGNLIVGYNEPRTPDSPDPIVDRTGSHNIVTGIHHNYSSWGGLVAGFRNTIASDSCCVVGGIDNKASGSASSVTGGIFNEVTGYRSCISGGAGNQITGDDATITGGVDNTASGPWSSVSGGSNNNASGLASSITGGDQNTATGERSTVCGGKGSTADQNYEILGDSYTKPRFVDNGDGTVTDKHTGLMWEKVTNSGLRPWYSAKNYCDSLSLAGHNDWRMPNLEELRSIVDETRENPAIDPVFEVFSSSYWSSSAYPSDSGYAWHVHFRYGYATYDGLDFLYSVRAVRCGP